MAKKDIRELEEQRVARIIHDEYTQGKANTSLKISDFEASVDLLECERTEKNYDWQSDICLPEFAAQMLTLSSDEANQYFQTRDFVEVYLEDDSEEATAKADANKELINRTLNQRYLRFFHKFMRANIVKDIGGEVYLKCGWERETQVKQVPVQRLQELDVDEYGNEIIDPSIQQRAIVPIQEIQPQEVVTVDRFNFDIIDRRNIFMSNEYCYSLQDKRWIIVREEKTINQLKQEAEQEGYINLDVLVPKDKVKRKVKPTATTETSQESFNKDDQETQVSLKDNEPYDIVHRYGQFWAVVRSYDEAGNPVDIEIGIDQNGEVKKDAQLYECICSTLISGSTAHLIRFIPQPFKDAYGKPYRPLIRGLCYIHPSKDMGLGDGKYARELSIGINDTFNVSNDRVMLATLPTMKVKEFSWEDNTQIYIQPGHTIPVKENDDISEVVISDNIQGALSQINILRMMMSGVTSIFPPALGNVPEMASTTATAVAGSEQNKGRRNNYRALTFEHTLLNELYWMITQMTFQFAEEETAMRLMGEKAINFDPTAEFTYKPLSQSIETEYSKANQIRELNQMMSVLAPVVGINPKGASLINFMVARIFELFGDEYAKFSKFLLDEKSPVGGQTGTNQPMPMQNQMGMPQNPMEMQARGM